MNKILTGNSLDVLKTLDDNSIDAVITDPPYGYSFMGKDWDKAVPSVEIWQECLRVLKPGAFCMVMSAPRSDVQMHMIQNLSEAGFRLDFTPIYWTYASGFPKAGNIGKLVDKRLGVAREVVGKEFVDIGMQSGSMHSGRTTEVVERDKTSATSPEAKALDGSYAGFQPKPAVEVIIVAMKPLSEKTFVDQALKNGKGISWLDDGRIPSEPRQQPEAGYIRNGRTDEEVFLSSDTTKTGLLTTVTGRFPANLLVSDDVLNDGTITGGDKRKVTKAQSDDATSLYQGGWKPVDTPRPNDSGSYSRYFDLDKWASTLPFLIVPKASKSEKNKGLEGFEKKWKGYGNQFIAEMKRGNDPSLINNKSSCTITKMQNFHPTVKPLKLMSYLITLTTREGDTVLDPFCGSGTTCIASKQLKREYIGIEREAEYVEIAEARLGAVEEEKQLELI